MTMTSGKSGVGIIAGVGVDIVEIPRMRKAIRRWGARFLDRVFLTGEQADCEKRAQPWIHYAGRFALKEAVAKALGTGIGVGAPLDWLDIEVASEKENRAPTIRFSPAGKRKLRARGAGIALVSVSHARDYAVAQAVLLANTRKGSCK